MIFQPIAMIDRKLEARNTKYETNPKFEGSNAQKV